MQRYLCFRPNYEKEIMQAFQEYAIHVMYGDIILGSDIVNDYTDDSD